MFLLCKVSFVPNCIRRKNVAKKDRRRMILGAALKVFAEQGLISPPIPFITKTAGVATGTFYSYFTSRDDLINTLYDEVESQITSHICSLNISSIECTEDKIKNLIAGLLNFFLEDRSRLFFLCNFHNSPYGANLRKNRGLASPNLGSILSQLLQEGIDEGLVIDMPIDIHFKYCVDVLMSIARDHHLSVQTIEPPHLDQIALMSIKSIKRSAE
jgi:AcrR family transcriptional regulator